MNKVQICAQGDRREPGALKAGAGTGIVLPWLLPLDTPSTTFKLWACSLVSPSFSWLHHHHCHHHHHQQQHRRGKECGCCQHQQQKAGMNTRVPITACTWEHEGDSELDGQEKFPPSPAAVFREAPGLDAAHKKLYTPRLVLLLIRRLLSPLKTSGY